MQSKLFLPAKLLCVLALAFLLFFPTPKGIRENLLRSATGVKAFSASLISHGDEWTITSLKRSTKTGIIRVAATGALNHAFSWHWSRSIGRVGETSRYTNCEIYRQRREEPKFRLK